MGNSAEYILASEVPGPTRTPMGTMRDASGALKRQAVRFRIYGYDAKGKVVKELTADNAEIEWTVHVANAKAAWYRRGIALDIPEAVTTVAFPRNRNVTGVDRKALILDPGSKAIQGRSRRGKHWHLIAPGFGAYKNPIYLGELRTDNAGRLIFLGGMGRSESPAGMPVWDGTSGGFSNADGWFDDTSDGPVTATVKIGRGKKKSVIPTDGAWVVAAGPDYAPDLVSVRTLYDVVFDLFVQQKQVKLPDKPSFTRDVYPILKRLTDLQWANQGFAAEFGRGAPYDFENPRLVARLASASIGSKELRLQIFHSFRDPNPDSEDNDRRGWPYLYGDAMNATETATARQHATVTPTQYAMLKLWSAGTFQEDWDPRAKPVAKLAQLPLADQPSALDRAHLDSTVADAFHPGLELGWPMRQAGIYSSPFRIKRRKVSVHEADFGPFLTSEAATGLGGPLNAQGPGTLTRWMALPWQADAAFCRSGEDREFDPFLPTFWPATIPNQVLALPDYEKAVNKRLPRKERLAAFSERRQWHRFFTTTGGPADIMQQMVNEFDRMGVLEERPGPKNDPDLPERMLVETTHPSSREPKQPKRILPHHEAGFQSEEAQRKFADFMRQVRRRAAPSKQNSK